MSQESDKKDIFVSIGESFDKIHNSIEQSTPVYTQSLSNLQQEYLTAWKNMMCSNITLQKEYVKKIGLNTESKEITTQVIQKVTDEMIKGLKIQSKFIQTWLDTSKQNIHRINENSITFTEVNKKFINSLTSVGDFKK